MKKIESLLKIAGMKFEFLNLENRFHKRQVSFLVVKIVKCKRTLVSQEGDTGCFYGVSPFLVS